MLKPADNYFLQQDEPFKSCLLALRAIILAHPHLSETWKYGMPMYCYRNKMFCYLWIHRKYRQPYLGIVEGGKIDHPLLLQEKRARMKILLIDPLQDIPVKIIKQILRETLSLYAN